MTRYAMLLSAFNIERRFGFNITICDFDNFRFIPSQKKVLKIYLHLYCIHIQDEKKCY